VLVFFLLLVWKQWKCVGIIVYVVDLNNVKVLMIIWKLLVSVQLCESNTLRTILVGVVDVADVVVGVVVGVVVIERCCCHKDLSFS
jgi:hypothetical protein